MFFDNIKDYLPKVKYKIKDACYALYKQLCDNISLVLMFILMGTIHLLYQGYEFGVSNHTIQIPFLKSYFHPELYPNDPLIATRPHFITFYFMFLAVIERLFGHLDLILFTVHLITEILVFAAVYYLAYTIFKDHGVATIALFLVFTDKIVLGDAKLHDWTIHTHTFSVLPLIFWSFALFLRQRTRKAYAILGFAANINIQSVIYVLPMFALVSLLRTREDIVVIGWRRTILDLLKDYGVFIIFALPCLIWAFATTGGSLTDEWIEQLRARSSHHSFPFSWGVPKLMSYLLFSMLGMISWALALRKAKDRKIHRTLGWFGLVVLLFCVIGTIFSELIPVKIILRVQSFRSTKYLTVFTVLYASYAIRYFWDKSVGHKILAVGTFLVMFLPDYLGFLILLVLLYQLVEARNLYWWTAPIVAAVLVLRVYVPHAEFPDNIDFRQIMGFIKPFLESRLKVEILVIFLLWMSIRKLITIQWLRHANTIVAFLAMFAYVLPATYHQEVRPVEQRGDWVRMQLWVKQNTPQDAMFLTPPYESGFRVYSERSIVAEWKDGTQQYFDVDYSYEWWARITQIGRNEGVYNNLSPEQLVEICRKYRASYIVFPAGKPLPFPHVYQDSVYRIYLLIDHYQPGLSILHKPGGSVRTRIQRETTGRSGESKDCADFRTLG